jgi:hypothetical protein
VEFTKDGAIINFEEEPKEEIVLPTSDDDPYGIIAKCKENGIENIETPHYIPEGFILTEFESDNNGFSNYIHFTYEKENQLISLTFEEYPDKPPESIGIPSDEHNIYEISLNGHVAAMSKEDNQINVLCIYDLKLIGLFTDGVDYSECDKILESYNIS